MTDDDYGALYESLTSVLREECGSLALHKFIDGETALDKELWQRAAELGWLGISLPEAVGGLGMGTQGLHLLHRAIGASCAPGPFAATLAVTQMLAEARVDTACGDIIAAVIAGDAIIAAPIAPGGERLVLSGGVLNGRSQSLLGLDGATLALVPARRGGENCLALVRIASPGATAARVDLWDRTRSAGSVACNDVEPVILIEDAGSARLQAYFRYLSLSIAADCVGAGFQIAEQTTEYLKGREQFGQSLASFQALKHRVANLYIALDPAAELTRQAALGLASGRPAGLMWTALAKAAAADAFRFVADDCVQLHGGVGYTWEYDCHIFLKRALLNEVIAGRSAEQRDAAATLLDGMASAGETIAEIVE